MLVESPANTSPSLTVRSRITNGSKLVAGVDMRSALGRRVKDLYRAFGAALDTGAADDVTVARLKTAAETRAIAEEARARFLRGETVSLEDVVRLENQAARAERALNIPKRRANAQPVADAAGSRILSILRREREGDT